MQLYITPDDFALGALGSRLAPGFPNPGTIVREIAKASLTVDRICNQRIGANGRTTLATAANAGDTVLSLASTLGMGVGQHAFVLLDTGNAQERLNVVAEQPIYDQGAPYPGTITLATPLTSPHALGAPVQAITVERNTARGGSTNSADFGGVITQDSQMAQVHAPHQMISDLVRKVFLHTPFLQQVISVAVVHRWTSQLSYLSIAGNLNVNPLGYYQVPLGTFIEQGAEVETSYIGGYGSVPLDVQDATELLVADQLTRATGPVAMGLVQAKIGDRNMLAEARGDKRGLSILYLRAEEKLARHTCLIP